jgi:alpha-glucosidase (family GH31 glycosyl hydrolase)
MEGGRAIERKVDLETMPLYVRAGAILPLGPVKQYVSQKVEQPLALRVFPGADGEFVLYEDDGSSFAYEKGQFSRIALHWNDKTRQLRASLVPGSRMLSETAREFEVELSTSGTKKAMRFTGAPAAAQF